MADVRITLGKCFRQRRGGCTVLRKLKHGLQVMTRIYGDEVVGPSAVVQFCFDIVGAAGDAIKAVVGPELKILSK